MGISAFAKTYLRDYTSCNLSISNARFSESEVSFQLAHTVEWDIYLMVAIAFSVFCTFKQEVVSAVNAKINHLIKLKKPEPTLVDAGFPSP